MNVQRLVSRAAPAPTIYQAVVDGALRLLDGDGGSLRFIDAEDPNWMVAVAWHGSAGQGERPIREHDRVIGSLVVSSSTEGRRWTREEWDLFTSYAEHAGAALTIARAGDAMRHALTDALTGLANRRMLLDRMEHELVRADRGGEPVTVLFLDLDGFKLVNDSLGHAVGDALLVAVAERLVSATREGDVCARLGGDEFAVLLAGASDSAATARRIIDVLQRGFRFGADEVFVSASVGIASGRDDADTLLRQADVAMYRAKRAGAGSYEHFEPGMHVELISRLTLGTELRRAIEHAEFELRYQPIIDLRSGRIVAFEALVRWRHATRGLVPPLEFIPIAEQTGMILEIGQWVLRTGCAQLAAWWRDRPIALSVNVSTRELQRAGYADAVGAAIGGAFPPSALILEITEREPLADVPGVLESLHAVKALGVRVALDDFGTGYSTVLNLSHLPVDVLKIAKPFLDGVDGGDPRSIGLLAATIGLGRHTGLTTVAEGIETAEQRDLLIELGCDLGQGYLLGRPLDAAATERLLADAEAAAD
ncbi:MAG: EAL domain-containing protein [Solirubrobacteraceae bacterium]